MPSRRRREVDVSDVLTTTEAAELLGVSPQRVRKLVAEGKFPAPIRTVGKTHLYAVKDVRRFIRQRAKKTGSPGRS